MPAEPHPSNWHLATAPRCEHCGEDRLIELAGRYIVCRVCCKVTKRLTEDEVVMRVNGIKPS